MLTVGASPYAVALAPAGRNGCLQGPRIMLLSCSFQGAGGYGTQAASLMARLAALAGMGRSNVGMAAIASQGPPSVLDGYPFYPLGDAMPFGRTTDAAYIADLVRGFGADIWLSLYDVRSVPGFAKAVQPAPWCPWVPIDCYPAAKNDVEALDGAHTVIAMSKFGATQLQAAGVPSTYIPHGIEPVFKVNPDPDFRQQMRRKIAGPNVQHLTAIVAANTAGDRKNYPAQIRAWAKFAADKPGAVLHLHSRPPWETGAPDLIAIVRQLGIQDKVVMPEIKFNTEAMVALYNAADVVLLATLGEGFGIPAVEAQACGIPVIVTDASAQPELLRWGCAVAVVEGVYVPYLGSWWSRPSEECITAALETLYAEWQAAGVWPLEQRQAVSKAVHQEFGWDNVFARHWTPLVQSLVSDKAHSYSP